MLMKKSDEPMIRPDKPDASRLQGAKSAVKSPRMARMNDIR